MIVMSVVCCQHQTDRQMPTHEYRLVGALNAESRTVDRRCIAVPSKHMICRLFHALYAHSFPGRIAGNVAIAMLLSRPSHRSERKNAKCASPKTPYICRVVDTAHALGKVAQMVESNCHRDTLKAMHNNNWAKDKLWATMQHCNSAHYNTTSTDSEHSLTCSRCHKRGIGDNATNAA